MQVYVGTVNIVINEAVSAAANDNVQIHFQCTEGSAGNGQWEDSID